MVPALATCSLSKHSLSPYAGVPSAFVQYQQSQVPSTIPGSPLCLQWPSLSLHAVNTLWRLLNRQQLDTSCQSWVHAGCPFLQMPERVYLATGSSRPSTRSCRRWSGLSFSSPLRMRFCTSKRSTTGTSGARTPGSAPAQLSSTACNTRSVRLRVRLARILQLAICSWHLGTAQVRA